MIGKRVKLIRMEDTGRGMKNQLYYGTVLDKIRSHEAIPSMLSEKIKRFAVDLYLVELPGGITELFHPSEVKQIVNEEKEQLLPSG